jgi:polyhydroxyalkanoate synthesis regulator phasin
MSAHRSNSDQKSSKRRRTSGEESTSKRERLTYSDTDSYEGDTDTDTDTDIDLNDTLIEKELTSPTAKMAMTDEDFIEKMVKALSDKRVKELTMESNKELIEEMAKKIEKKMETKIEKVDEKIKATNEEVEGLKDRIDELEQKAKSPNLIIAGEIEAADNDDIVKLLNEKLEMELTGDSIKYMMKLGKDDGKKLKRIRVVFTSEEIKERVMKNRKRLKGKKVYLTDDLTPQRSTLAYHARMAVKKPKLADSWVYDGKVFIKASTNGAVKKINNIHDIPD